MSVTSTTRLATTDEIAAEMDRRGVVIEALEDTIRLLKDELAAFKAASALDSYAVDYLVQRMTRSGELAYLIGRGTEVFARLTTAVAHRTGEDTDVCAARIWAQCRPVRVKPAYDD